jgi:hypothetical protein
VPCWVGMAWLVGTSGAAPPCSSSWESVLQLPLRANSGLGGVGSAGTDVLAVAPSVEVRSPTVACRQADTLGTSTPNRSATSNATVNDDIVGSSSPTNTWFFPEVSSPTTTKTLGLVWNGSAWRTVKVPATDSLLGVNVLGRHNVWQWGTKPAPPGTLGFGPPWLRHYNGTTWKTVPVPGVAGGASVVSATDMWAVGPTTATAGQAGPKQVYIAMHWNGKKWAAVRLPKLAPVNGAAWSPRGIVALGAANVWVNEVPQGSLGGEPGPQDTVLLHWNGKTWSRAAKDTGLDLDGMTGDGTGGLWLSGADATTQAGYLVHYAGGTFTPQAVPTESGYDGVAGALARVPGGTSVWGIGSLEPTGNGIDEGVIFRYGG